MGCKAALIVAFLCILQCGLYQAKNENMKNPVARIRILNKWISNPTPFQKQKPPNPYFRQFSRSCNTCRSSLCTETCKNNNSNQLIIKVPKNLVWVSVPGPNGQKIDIVIDDPKCVEGKEMVNVMVKVKDGNQKTNGNLSTTADSKASINKNGEQLTADTTANNVDVVVTVRDEGNLPEDTILNSGIIEKDDQGDILGSITQSKISTQPSNMPENNDKSPPSDSSSLPSKDSKNPPSDSSSSPDKDSAKPPLNSDSAPNTLVEVPASPDTGSPATKDAAEPADKPAPKNEPAPSSEGKKPTDEEKDYDSIASTNADSVVAAGDGNAVAASKTSGKAASGPSDEKMAL